MEKERTEMKEMRFLLAILIALLLFAPAQAFRVNSNGDHIIDSGALIAEEIVARDLKVEDLKSDNAISFPQASLEIADIDARTQADNMIPVVRSGVLVFEALALGSSAQAASATNATFQDSSVTGAKIEDGEIGNNQIADSAIIGTKIADGAVDQDKIADNSIGSDKIANPAVILDQKLTGYSSQAGAISANSSIIEAIASLDNRSASNAALLSSKLGANAAQLAATSFNGNVNVTGDLDVSGTTSGQAIIASVTTASTATNLAKAGNNNILYQTAADNTELVANATYSPEIVLAMDSNADPKPKWKKLALKKMTSLNGIPLQTSNNFVLNTCSKICRRARGICFSDNASSATNVANLEIGTCTTVQTGASPIACNCIILTTESL